MHPHAGKIPTEARLHKASRCGIKRPPRRTQRLMHAGWRLADGGLCRGTHLVKLYLLLAFRAFAADLRRGRRKRALWRRHTHYLLSDSIRLMLQRIIDGADFEFRLNGFGETRCRKLGWLLEFAAHPLGRKERYLAEIPSEAARSSFGTRAFWADILPGSALLVLEETLSPQKPEHRLVAKHMQIFATIVMAMARRCSGVKRRCVLRR